MSCAEITLSISVMGLDMYVDLVSPPCRAVVLMVRKNNIPCTEKTLDLFKGTFQKLLYKISAVNA